MQACNKKEAFKRDGTVRARSFAPPNLSHSPVVTTMAPKERGRWAQRKRAQHTCCFRGRESTRERQLRTPCAAAIEADVAALACCKSCLNGNASWVCLLC